MLVLSGVGPVETASGMSPDGVRATGSDVVRYKGSMSLGPSGEWRAVSIIRVKNSPSQREIDGVRMRSGCPLPDAGSNLTDEQIEWLKRQGTLLFDVSAPQTDATYDLAFKAGPFETRTCTYWVRRNADGTWKPSGHDAGEEFNERGEHITWRFSDIHAKARRRDKRIIFEGSCTSYDWDRYSVNPPCQSPLLLEGKRKSGKWTTVKTITLKEIRFKAAIRGRYRAVRVRIERQNPTRAQFSHIGISPAVSRVTKIR